MKMGKPVVKADVYWKLQISKSEPKIDGQLKVLL